MKTLLTLFLVGCAVQLSAVAQGTTQFLIEFPGAPPPPVIGIPSGVAELSGTSFHAAFFLGTSAASSGRILEMAADSTLTPVFEFSGTIVDSFPPTPGFPGSGGTYYSYDQIWQVTETQAQALLAGRWFAEIAYGSEIHMAQLVPVPEPSAATLSLLGLSVLGAAGRRFYR
jgi:hypothetical protein